MEAQTDIVYTCGFTFRVTRVLALGPDRAIIRVIRGLPFRDRATKPESLNLNLKPYLELHG